MKTALVIGGGPAGLMAADRLARGGVKVTVLDAMPSLGRKFLMAGKSGLNLTKDEPRDAFMGRYADAQEWLTPMISAFGPDEVKAFAQVLGQELFTGSTGRVFPAVMKASPMLRAWLARLAELGVETRTRWRWTGWDGAALVFETPEGPVRIFADVTVLACGGASWSRLGSDGAWSQWIPSVPFQPSNVGLVVPWSTHMQPHFGKALKAVRWTAGDSHVSRGEAVISRNGLEGGGIYPLIPALRDGAPLHVDLAPDLPVEKLAKRLPSSPKGGLTKILRNTLRWPPEKIALFYECTKNQAVPLNGDRLAPVIKSLHIRHHGPRPIDEAISTAGGVPRAALTEGLMLKERPGIFCAGEMLDWDAPTGGYLLTACFATGRWAGDAALAYAQR